MDSILLVGLPRSGTTWVAKIIDSNPDIVYRHEPDTEFRMEIPTIIEPGDSSYDGYIAQYCRDIHNKTGLRVCGKLPLFRKNYFNILTAALFKFSVLFSKVISRYGLKGKIFEIIQSDTTIKQFWKSIESSGRVGAIMRAMPGLKVVYLIRSPYGQLASVLDGEYQRKFSDSGSSSEDYGFFESLLKTNLAKQRQLTMDDIRTMSQLERLALKWLLLNEHALEEINSFPDRAHVVSYEAMCLDPESTVAELFRFLGLELGSQTREFLSNDKNDDNYYSVFKNSAVSADKWKDKITPEQKQVVDRLIEGTLSGSFYGL